MKQVTFDKYVDFLRALAANGTIYDMNDFKRTSHVGDAFVNFLIKNKYLFRKAGGSFKLVDCPIGFNHIVNEYKKQTENKQAQAVSEFVESVGKAYPKQTELEKTIQLHIENDTIASREQAAIDILGTIMRDNANITYDLIRNERKEVKTDLLAR
jgi:hypothetical protein